MIQSCSIQKYSSINIKPDSLHIYVNRPPSTVITEYDTMLTVSWNLTFSKCTQFKIAIDKEIDVREKRQNNINQIFIYETTRPDIVLGDSEHIGK